MRTPHAKPIDSRRRSGITLVELLVVIIIVSVVVAAAIPVALPAIESRRMREAARGVNLFLLGARSRAMEIGRPVGVLFQRAPEEPRAVTTLRYVEVPPPFAGFTYQSRARIVAMMGTDPATGDPALGYFLELVETTGVPLHLPDGFLRYNDWVQLNYQGSGYTLVPDWESPLISNAQDSNGDGFIASPSGENPRIRVQPDRDGSIGVWATLAADGDTTAAFQFQVHRQPAPSAAQPYQLPEGTVIDLVGSGLAGSPMGEVVFDPRNYDNRTLNPISGNDIQDENGDLVPDLDIMATFEPDGAVRFVYGEAGGRFWAERPLTPLHLLIGKRENILTEYSASSPTAAPDDWNRANWRQPGSYWITLSQLTGRVSSTENAPLNPATLSTGTPTVADEVVQARRFTTTGLEASGG
ncbi:MAG: prepilin-type N-terminal cleavage/methylation domain-containing protein [Pirellulales bacterium]